MARGRTMLSIAVFAAFCLALAYWWSIRVGLPLGGRTPWWYGKNAFVRMQVVEPDHDIATVSMRLPKGMMDTMVALGTNAKIEIGEGGRTVIGTSHPDPTRRGRSIPLRDVWKDLQKLPEGQKLTFEEDGATITMWIEAK